MPRARCRRAKWSRREFLSGPRDQSCFGPETRFKIKTKVSPSGGKEHSSRGGKHCDVMITRANHLRTNRRSRRHHFGRALANHEPGRHADRHPAPRPVPPSGSGARRHRLRPVGRGFELESQFQPRGRRLPCLLWQDQRNLFKQRRAGKRDDQYVFRSGRRRHLLLRRHRLRYERTGKQLLE